jgi:hypothetical protein
MSPIRIVVLCSVLGLCGCPGSVAETDTPTTDTPTTDTPTTDTPTTDTPTVDEDRKDPVTKDEKTDVEPTQDSIGKATMEGDGTIVLTLRAEGPDAVGDALLRYPRSHASYDEVLAHLGGLEPGETKPCPPWPDKN